MEFRPDSRHLSFGLVAALLMTGWFAWTGMSNPAAEFYTPEYNAHATAYQITCIECHEPWKPASNDLCISCHERTQHRGMEKNFLREPESSPTGKFHAMLGRNRTCVECHVEHRKSRLSELLALAPEERPKQRDWNSLIHDKYMFEWTSMANSCVKCHVGPEFESAGAALPEAVVPEAPAPEAAPADPGAE